MKVKEVISMVFLVGFVVMIFSLFPIKKIVLHDREAYVMVSRIYPIARPGDCVILENGKVKDIEELSSREKYYGRIVLSSTEGLL